MSTSDGSVGHTPGPWKVISGNGVYFPSVLLSGGHQPEIVINAGGGPLEEHEANARLIAESPAMLEALESAPIIRLGETLDTFQERYTKWYRDVRHTAISRARGLA